VLTDMHLAASQKRLAAAEPRLSKRVVASRFVEPAAGYVASFEAVCVLWKEPEKDVTS
jgi:hypothetical protein